LEVGHKVGQKAVRQEDPQCSEESVNQYKFQDREAKALGLDAEKKIEVSGGIKYELVGVDPEDLV
jgi:hypothetical protein